MKKTYDKQIKKQVAYLQALLKNAVDDPASLQRYPQTIENWLRVIEKELAGLAFWIGK